LHLKKIAAHLPGSTSSETTFRTIKGWLNECTISHKCRHGNSKHGHDQRASPKRLLQIIDDKVILKENVGQQPYACLSYCWGESAQIIQTKQDTIEHRRKSIPWNQLNATFQDAITVCRHLEISYLWIDALCIIQDSDEDWKEQASQMANIYANAYLTIAATNSSDASGGCFRNTSEEYMSKLLPGYKDTYTRQKLPKLPLMSDEAAIGESPNWPLLSRGWAYQEMRLSPRVLHFCAQEVVWVCRVSQKSESMDNDEDLTSKGAWNSMVYPYVPYSVLEKDPQSLWYRTVDEYSRLRLSKEEDKMAALSGLAEQMQHLRLGDRYLVGLWEKTLLVDLLWHPTRHNVVSKARIARYPSWSWASSPFQVQWFFGVNQALKCTRIDDIEVINRGPSHLADCIEARITLRAPLL
ncbi:heterokaryon incompatibility protein-domain-containing protein, partial [Colletotrichum acutatum]